MTKPGTGYLAEITAHMHCVCTGGGKCSPLIVALNPEPEQLRLHPQPRNVGALAWHTALLGSFLRRSQAGAGAQVAGKLLPQVWCRFLPGSCKQQK